MSVDLSGSSSQYGEMGKMAGEVDAWLQTVTGAAASGESGIICGVDFVSKDVLNDGSEREVARAAACTMAPREDMVAAAIAVGQTTLKQSCEMHADMSISKADEPKSLGSPTPESLLQQFKNRFSYSLYIPHKKAASGPALLQYLRIVILVIMVLSGVGLTHMTLVRLGQPGILDKPIHHAKHLLHMVRGKLKDKHANCEEWAGMGGCSKNPVFMKDMCRKSCYHAPHFDDVLVDLNSHCTDWAPHGECLNNPKFMMINCPKSCSELEKVVEQQRAEVEAEMDRKEQALVATQVASVQDEDKSEYCPQWAMKGECASNPDFMTKECPKSCAGAPAQ